MGPAPSVPSPDDFRSVTQTPHIKPTPPVPSTLNVNEITPREKVSFEDFIPIKLIGRGSFGKVLLVKKKDNGNFYALKMLKKAVIIEGNQIQHTITEKNVLQQINHPFIINLRYAFQSEHNLYLVLDFASGGDLFFHLRNSHKFSEERCRLYAAEIILAFEELHKRDIIYRDLKPENVLLTSDGHACLTDFGLSKNLANQQQATTFCGTSEYLAPEMLRSQSHGKAVDWWALGTFLYEILTGTPPFYSTNTNKVFELILTKEVVYPAHLSPEAKDLLVKLLMRNPAERLGGGKDDAVAVKGHPFFRGLDWDAVYLKKYSPEFIPTVKAPDDLSNVDPEFLNEPLFEDNDSPPQGFLSLSSETGSASKSGQYTNNTTRRDEHNRLMEKKKKKKMIITKKKKKKKKKKRKEKEKKKKEDREDVKEKEKEKREEDEGKFTIEDEKEDDLQGEKKKKKSDSDRNEKEKKNDKEKKEDEEEDEEEEDVDDDEEEEEEEYDEEVEVEDDDFPDWDNPPEPLKPIELSPNLNSNVTNTNTTSSGTGTGTGAFAKKQPPKPPEPRHNLVIEQSPPLPTPITSPTPMHPLHPHPHSLPLPVAIPVPASVSLPHCRPASSSYNSSLRSTSATAHSPTYTPSHNTPTPSHSTPTPTPTPPSSIAGMLNRSCSGSSLSSSSNSCGSGGSGGGGGSGLLNSTNINSSTSSIKSNKKKPPPKPPPSIPPPPDSTDDICE